MNIATATATAALNPVTSLFNNGTLKWYQGTIPATPETAIGAQTLLVSFTFAATAFGTNTLSGGLEQETASFVANSVLPSANGTACFGRAFKSDGTTVIADFTIAAPWVASVAVVAGQYVTNGGSLYQCTTAGTTAASGGPSGTGTSITDNTAVWKYIGAGSADITIGNTSLQTTVNASITSFVLGVPAL